MPEQNKIHVEMNTLLEEYPFLKQILQSIKQVVWLIDLSTDRILYVNPAFETNWGQPLENLYSDPFTLIKSVHPEDRVKVLSANLGVSRKSLDQTYRILRPDGSLRWISAHTFLINEESSTPSFQVCVAQDITEQYQIEQTLQKALKRSRETSILSRKMSLARKPEAVLKTLMSASELSSANHAAVLFFESPISGLIHQIEVVASWSPDSLLAVARPNELAGETSLFEDLALLNLFHSSKPVVVTGISKDMRLLPETRDWLETRKIESIAIFPLVALRNWLGCLLVFSPRKMHLEPFELKHIQVLVDQAAITLYNLQLLEIEAESRHEAERANEIKTEFLAMISHELRTPLTSIIGFTTTLLAEDVTWEPDEQRDFIQTIHREADRLQELINHLLDLSRLEAQMLPITQKHHSLQEIMEDAMPQFSTLTNQHIFTLNLPPDLPPVYVDAKRIAQVLVNLVRNASSYSPKGTEISISAKVRGRFVQVNVIDQGPGIPPAEHKKVFKSFQQGSNVRNGSVQGTGLGLAICKGLVEAHGGRIWIKKRTNTGATISFTIPLAPEKTLASLAEKER